MLNKHLLIKFFLVSLLIALLAACASSRVNQTHSGLTKSITEKSAKVYFLRPWGQRTRGVADNDVEILLKEESLLTLAEGEYVLLKVKPQKSYVTIKSETYLTTKPNPVTVSRTREFEFEAGKTYYLTATFQQEEFRGIYFFPKLVTEAEAKEFAARMNPVNELAQKKPLSTAK
ncbi:MAG: hypothetical protein OEZ47_01925 [Gammaproteobacteria bacterium]|nr:hypothetical protein [Gammaproteobacteria bacterium]